MYSGEFWAHGQLSIMVTMIMVIQVSLAFRKVCVREKASSVYYPLGPQVTTSLKVCATLAGLL